MHLWASERACKRKAYFGRVMKDNDNTESKILVNTIEEFFGEILNKLRDQNS